MYFRILFYYHTININSEYKLFQIHSSSMSPKYLSTPFLLSSIIGLKPLSLDGKYSAFKTFLFNSLNSFYFYSKLSNFNSPNTSILSYYSAKILTYYIILLTLDLKNPKVISN